MSWRRVLAAAVDMTTMAEVVSPDSEVSEAMAVIDGSVMTAKVALAVVLVELAEVQ